MYGLMKNRSAATVRINGWRQDAVGSICSARSIRKRRKDRVVIGFEGEKRRWWGVCGVFRGDFLAEYMVVEGRSCDDLSSIRTKRRQLVGCGFCLLDFIGSPKHEQ